MVRITYSSSFLKSLNRNYRFANPQLEKDLNKLQICVKKTKRGCRGGLHKRRLIRVVEGNRPHNRWQLSRPSSVLVPVPKDPSLSQMSSRTKISSLAVPRFFLTNVRSAMNKLDELDILLHQPDDQIDIAVLTETWQSDKICDDFLAIDGFNVFTRTRDMKRGGGVAVYVKEQIPVTVLDNINVPDELECLWLRVCPHRLPRSVAGIVVCAVYIPPNSSQQSVLVDHLISTVDELNAKHPDIGVTILGDFNRTEIGPICRSHALSQVVNKPTRENATLDLIITNLKRFYEDPSVRSPVGCSDHVTIYWSPKQGHHIQCSVQKRTVRPLIKSRMYEFGRWITSYAWEEVLSGNSTQDKADAFYATLNTAIETHFPSKVVKIHSSDKPWITPEMKNLIKKRQTAFTQKKTYLWRFLRNKVKYSIRQAKKSFYKDRLENLKTQDPSGWHKGIQLITNKVRQCPIINAPGISQDDEKAIAEEINKTFASVSQSRPPLDHSALPAFLPANPPPQIHVWEVYKELSKLNARKSAGPDGMPGRILKEFACELSTPVADILNASLREGCVPQMWKDATVVPVPKEMPATITKLRPISLTALLAKVCEGIVSKLVLKDIGNSIDRNQYGSIKGSSTTHCLIEMLDVFYKGTDVSNSVGTLVVTDFSKAFDSVDHTLAIQKLCAMGVRSEIIPWIADFLTSRRQRVQYHSVLSDWEILTCGVPQGTKFGPIIFIALINDASENSAAHSFKYVDDLSLAEVRQICEPSQMDADVRDLDAWANHNHLRLNPSKCKVMQICFKRQPPSPPDLCIAGKRLEVVNETRLLGLIVQSDLCWDLQINSMVSKSSCRLYMLCCLKRFGVPVSDLISVYIGYVRPIVEYACPVWHGSINIKQSQQIERIQKRACRIIIGSTYTSYAEALSVTGLQTLEERRHHLCTQFARKCCTSGKYSGWFPLNNRTHTMNLRNTHTYQVPRFRTSRYGNSAIPHLIKLLN